MKKQVALILVLTCIWALWAGCGIQTSSETGEPKAIELSQEELAYFNGNSFFNRDSFDIRNQFLTSLYSKPEEIDLYELFYNGADVTDQAEGDHRAEGEELADFIKASGASCGIDELPCPCTKIKKSDMDDVLKTNMGIELAQTDGVGLDKFLYLSKYDSYYDLHGDTNYIMNIRFSRGERQGNLTRLYYSDIIDSDGNKVLTLKETDGIYLFVSNQMDYSKSVSG